MCRSRQFRYLQTITKRSRPTEIYSLKIVFFLKIVPTQNLFLSKKSFNLIRVVCGLVLASLRNWNPLQLGSKSTSQLRSQLRSHVVGVFIALICDLTHLQKKGSPRLAKLSFFFFLGIKNGRAGASPPKSSEKKRKIHSSGITAARNTRKIRKWKAAWRFDGNATKSKHLKALSDL